MVKDPPNEGTTPILLPQILKQPEWINLLRQKVQLIGDGDHQHFFIISSKELLNNFNFTLL